MSSPRTKCKLALSKSDTNAPRRQRLFLQKEPSRLCAFASALSRSLEEPRDAPLEGDVVDHFRRRILQQIARARRVQGAHLPYRTKRQVIATRRQPRGPLRRGLLRLRRLDGQHVGLV